MEIWTVVGVDTKATDKNKATGVVTEGVKFHLVGPNFDDSDPQRYLGDCVSVLFLSNALRSKFKYDPLPGEKIKVAYDRWGHVSLFEPA